MYFDINEQQLPIIYRSEYNVHFWGLEKLHPFDAGKWGNIIQYLFRSGCVREENVVKPKEPSKTDLGVVHTRKYLRSLKVSNVLFKKGLIFI